MARISPPEHLPQATQFSGAADINDPVWLIRTLRRTAWAYRPLRDAVAGLEQNWARHREPGEWGAVYLAFVVSRRPDIQPWHAETTAALWREAGFAGKPPYSRVYAHFTELEGLADAFIECAGELIKHARRHDDRIGQHVHVDSTEAETHAGLKHVCCTHRRRGRAARPRRVATADVREERHAEANEAPPAHPTTNMGEVEAVRDLRTGRYFKIRGHWYRSIDKTAGIRAYTGKRQAVKFWHGFYNQKAIDHYTGGVLAVDVFSASEQEYHSYPELAEQLERNLGAQPQAVVFDRGFSVASVFEHNSTRGIATVAPWRKSGGKDREDSDKPTHDRHGVPRCKHCGGDTRFIRFHPNGGRPRIWFHCNLELTPACAKDQSISCSTDWRLLVPLWRTDPIYHSLRASHSNYERGQHHWRQRYLVAGDDRVTRPKRRGIGCQRLRAAGALVCEWIRILHREGWLVSARLNRSQPQDDGGSGHRHASHFIRYRHKVGLDRPYGIKAHRLGVGPVDPPKRKTAKMKKNGSSSGSSPPSSASP